MTETKALLPGLGCHGPLACIMLLLNWYFPLSRTAGPYVTLNWAWSGFRSGAVLSLRNSLPVYWVVRIRAASNNRPQTRDRRECLRPISS